MNENQENQVQHLTLTLRGNPEAVVYEDIVGYQLGSGFIGIIQRDGSMRIIPSDRVEEVVITIEKE